MARVDGWYREDGEDGEKQTYLSHSGHLTRIPDHYSPMSLILVFNRHRQANRHHTPSIRDSI